MTPRSGRWLVKTSGAIVRAAYTGGKYLQVEGLYYELSAFTWIG